MTDFVLNPRLSYVKTDKFWCISASNGDKRVEYRVFVDLNCSYTAAIVKNAVARRPWFSLINNLHDDQKCSGNTIIQISDFENIEWEHVMSGNQMASSYLVRKGLSRKAQLSLQIRRYISKHPNTCLKTSFPFTLIVETWNAYENMKLDFGRGTLASFDSFSVSNAPLRSRLDWCLAEIKETLEDEDKKDWVWILKPSVTNKGMNIAVVDAWEGVLDYLEDEPDIREWVLQRYIEKPLLVNGYKFHLRVYVLCVGALRVYVFERILMLLAAHKYDLYDFDDVYKHLTNTARSAEDIAFKEEDFVKVLDDLPAYLCKERPRQYQNVEQAEDATAKIRAQIRDITADLFAAYENEYTIFAPMSNCFELYGLDFMVDCNMKVSLLEVNPGPDVKQTGDRLRGVIVDLWDQILSLSTNPAPSPQITPNNNFALVYGKEWSASRVAGGMKFTEE